MNIYKIIEVVGLTFQIFAGALFLLDQTLKYWNNTLDGLIKKLQEWISRQLMKRRVILTLISFIVIGIILAYFYFIFMQTGEFRLSDTSPVDIAIGIIFASLFVLAAYSFLFKYALKLMERWRLTKRFIQGRGIGNFISLNIFMLIIAFVLAILVIVPILFEPLKQIFLVMFLAVLLLFALGGAFAVSFIIISIFSIFKYFCSLPPKWFWTDVLIMWVIGGLLLLVNACWL